MKKNIITAVIFICFVTLIPGLGIMIMNGVETLHSPELSVDVAGAKAVILIGCLGTLAVALIATIGIRHLVTRSPFTD